MIKIFNDNNLAKPFFTCDNCGEKIPILKIEENINRYSINCRACQSFIQYLKEDDGVRLYNYYRANSLYGLIVKEKNPTKAVNYFFGEKL